MFSRIYASVLYVMFALTLLAAATPKPWNTGPTTTVTVTAPASTSTIPSSACSTGPVQCCDSTEKANSLAGTTLLGTLGIALQGLDVLLGVNCSPISVIGAGGGNCNSNAVCCENNSFGSLISIGCVPVIL